MQTIVVASRKGGVGKTTIAGHLSVALGEAVAIIDTDPQQSLADWFHARGSSFPVLFGCDVASLQESIRNIADHGYKFCIIDTPPAIGDNIKRAIRVADLVMIPTRPSPHDLRAIGRTVDLVDKESKRMVFVLNGATPRARLTGASAIELSQHGTVSPIALHHRIDYQSSMISGLTAQELSPQSKSAGEVQQLRDYVLAQLGRSANTEILE